CMSMSCGCGDDGTYMEKQNVFVDNQSDDGICVNIKRVNEQPHYNLIDVPRGIGEVFEVDHYIETARPTYQFRIFKHSTIKKHDYQQKELIDNRLHDELYVYTYDQLEAMNFIVKYPQDEKQ
ncbi:MAG: hypothetical protein K2M65_01990, partial [Muribaculaceae bacterium]|nr:hypothetical protein [Muribaculaceae bacterium]